MLEEDEDTVPIDKDGTRDIWDASLQGSLPGVRYYYRENPFNINKLNRRYYYYSPLDYASKEGHLKLVTFLLSKHADVNSISSGKSTPLMKASERGHLNIVNLLLDNGAQVNFQNINNCTSLHKAVYANHLEVVKLLIERGAEKELKDNINETPLDYARYLGNENSILTYLSSIKPLEIYINN